MIYTVTFNPALDYVVHLDNFIEGKTCRSKAEEIYIGGKGINVSLMLSNLGIKSTALGFYAGFTGEYLLKALKEKGINADFIRLKSGNTRINIKIKGKKESEINAEGPFIEESELLELMSKLEKLKSGDTLVLSGSIPPTLPKEIYEKILSRLSDRNIKFVVDTTGETLINTLKFKPFLIKPNRDELEELVNRELKSEEEIISAAKELKGLGAQNVLVSMGADGSVLVDEYGKVYIEKAFKGKAVNTVGAGDSMLAGFISQANEGYEKALKFASAAGSATAFSKDIGTKKEIEKLLNLK